MVGQQPAVDVQRHLRESLRHVYVCHETRDTPAPRESLERANDDPARVSRERRAVGQRDGGGAFVEVDVKVRA